jgi:protein-S-isoprenylcysteine O-methyltransferase Ste14
MIWQYLIEVPWIVFVTYWVAGAFKTRKTVSQQSSASRYIMLALEIIGFVLLFSSRAGVGGLGQRIVHPNYALAVVGITLTWIGIALALWARWNLGQFWSARITLKEDHELIRTGPYTYFRHPIYSGLDLAALGGVLAINRWRCVLGVVLIVLGYWIKARKEESLLAAQFGAAFKEHCCHTGFLLPKF